MYWKMYADYRKEHIITTGMCTPRLAEIAHCEIRNLHRKQSSNQQITFIGLLSSHPLILLHTIIALFSNACSDTNAT